MAEGKAHLRIAIGCTGGRHRSVAIAEHLAARYRPNDDLWSRSPTATSRRPPSGPELGLSAQLAKERTRP